MSTSGDRESGGGENMGVVHCVLHINLEGTVKHHLLVCQIPITVAELGPQYALDQLNNERSRVYYAV